MSNKDIYDQLTSIQSRLNEGVQIIAVDETNKAVRSFHILICF